MLVKLNECKQSVWIQSQRYLFILCIINKIMLYNFYTIFYFYGIIYYQHLNCLNQIQNVKKYNQIFC